MMSTLLPLVVDKMTPSGEASDAAASAAGSGS
jgi:uncharacterized protein YidB (DUF937 family)